MKMTEALILCGGMGTRLASVVPNKQKALAEVRGVPVLDMIIIDLIAYGFTRIVLATGFRGDEVREHVKKMKIPARYEIIVSEESSPLGTGGAVRNALPHVRYPHFLTVNGDTFFSGIDFADFLRFHLEKKAAVTLVAVKPRAEEDYGAIEIGADGKAAFREKAGTGRFMSAGAYWIDRSITALTPEGKSSLENDLFPYLAAEGRLYGYASSGTIHDIGTPERYRSANEGTGFV